MNFTKFYPCFGFADVKYSVNLHCSGNSSFQQTTEAVVRDLTVTPPRQFWVSAHRLGNTETTSNILTNKFNGHWQTF